MDAIRRVILVVLDSVGAGDAPDAAAFGDVGADTLGHIHSSVGLEVPNLRRMGLARVARIGPFAGPVEGAHGRLTEVSMGKDTMTGHFELAGLFVEVGYPSYPEGFPPEVMRAFEERIGRRALGNVVASGTAILDDLGPEHLATGRPIVYTSADSVFQIAAHVDVVPLATLYDWCHAARDVLVAPHQVARVIARPFAGRPGAFERTKDRKDYALAPPEPTILDHVTAAGHRTVAVGKIGDIFSREGIETSIPAKGNPACVDATLEAMAADFSGMIFTNLVDFDTQYGHRRDPAGYRNCLEEFDRRVPDLQAACKDGDLLVLTADHGNDPTYRGTDHTRERVPLLAWRRGIGDVDLGTRATYSDVAMTIDEVFALGRVARGTSFLDLLR